MSSSGERWVPSESVEMLSSQSFARRPSALSIKSDQHL